MSSKKQQIENGATQTQTGVTNVDPVGDQAGRIELGSGHHGGMRPASYLITVIVTISADLEMWGRVDEEWGLHSGRYGTAIGQGKIGVALSVGTHHIVVEDVGIYDELFFTTSVAAAATSVKVRPIVFSNYGS